MASNDYIKAEGPRTTTSKSPTQQVYQRRPVEAKASVLPPVSLRSKVQKISPPTGQFIIGTAVQVAGFAAAIAFGVYAIRSVSVAVSSENVALQANNLSREALDQSLLANKLALIALCNSGNVDNETSSACSQVLGNVPVVLSSVASRLGFPTGFPESTSSAALPSSTSAATPTSNASGSSQGSVAIGPIVGGVVGGVVFVILVTAFTCLCSRARSHKSEIGLAPAELPQSQPYSTPGIPARIGETEAASGASMYSTAPDPGEEVNAAIEMGKKKRSWGVGAWFRRTFIESTIRSE